MTVKSKDELLELGNVWFRKLYVTGSSTFNQMNARRPNKAPEFDPKKLLNHIEEDASVILQESGKAIAKFSKEAK